MKREQPLRERPKEKPFRNGGYWYNPELDPSIQKACRSESTAWMAKTTDPQQMQCLIATRARHARIERWQKQRLRNHARCRGCRGR